VKSLDALTTQPQIAYQQRNYLENTTIRYDTRCYFNVPTLVSLIYRTETTTKNCKTEKLKSKNGYATSNSKSLGNHVVIGVVSREVGGLAPQILDHGHFFQNGISIWHLLYTLIHNHPKIQFALIQFKLHEI